MYIRDVVYVFGPIRHLFSIFIFFLSSSRFFFFCIRPFLCFLVLLPFPSLEAIYIWCPDAYTGNRYYFGESFRPHDRRVYQIHPSNNDPARCLPHFSSPFTVLPCLLSMISHIGTNFIFPLAVPCRTTAVVDGRKKKIRLATTVVVAGYSSGGVRFFHAGNGTELGSADTGTGAVLAVKRGGQVKGTTAVGYIP